MMMNKNTLRSAFPDIPFPVLLALQYFRYAFFQFPTLRCLSRIRSHLISLAQ